MTEFSRQFKERLERLFQEEEKDLYILTTHYHNDSELAYFDEISRRKIKNIFDVLIRDTKRHSEILERLMGPG